MIFSTFLRRCAVTALGVFALLSTAQAAVIQYSKRSITAPIDNTDYRASFDAQTSAITTRNLSAFTNVDTDRNSFSRLRISFSIASAYDQEIFGFEIAPDATHGGALYLDGQLVDIDTSDLYWALNWANISELLTVSGRSSFVGSHVLEAYWAEDCCGGNASARFTADGGRTYQAMTVANLDRYAVPLPGTLAMAGLGLAALGLVRRRA